MQSAYDEGMAGQDETSVEVATRLFDLLTDTLERRTRELSIGGSSTLFSLWRWGPRRATSLAALEGVNQPAMTALIGSLERSGMVERRPDPADGRASLIAITDSGAAYMQERVREHVHMLAVGIDAMSERRRSELFSATDALVELAERLRVDD